ERNLEAHASQCSVITRRSNARVRKILRHAPARSRFLEIADAKRVVAPRTDRKNSSDPDAKIGWNIDLIRLEGAASKCFFVMHVESAGFERKRPSAKSKFKSIPPP